MYLLIKEALNKAKQISNWKLLILLHKAIRIIPDLEPFYEDHIIAVLESNYKNFQEFLNDLNNLQQSYFFLNLLINIKLRNKNNYFGNIVEELSIKNTIKQDITATMLLFLLENTYQNSDTIFLPSKINSKITQNGKTTELKALQFANRKSSFVIQCIYDKIYIWEGSNSCIELCRSNFDVVKNLRSEVSLQVNFENEPEVNILNTNLNLKHITSKIMSFHIAFQSFNESELFFYKNKISQRISQAISVISLNYLDFGNDSENEIEKQSYNEEITSLPEELKETETKETRIENQKLSQMKPATQLITPENSDMRARTDEWEIRESIIPTDGKNSFEIEDVKSFVTEDLQLENSPIVLAQKRKMAREATRTLNEVASNFDLEGREANNNNSSLVITKLQKDLTKHKFQTNGPPSEKINKTDKVTTNNRSIDHKNISLLNTIFNSNTCSTSKRYKNKILKKANLKKQKTLNNIKQVITIPSQDVQSIQTETLKENPRELAIIPEDGPALRTRAQKIETKIKKNDVTNKRTKQRDNEKISGAIVKKNPEKSEVEIEVSRDSNLPSIPFPKKQKTKRQDKKDNSVLQESTTIINTGIAKPTNICNPDLFLQNQSQSFTNHLQDQINNSIAMFSNDLIRKLSLINEEINHKILSDLSLRYQNSIQDLRMKFENDTEQILGFISEIKSLLNLPEEELVSRIRNGILPSKPSNSE